MRSDMHEVVIERPRSGMRYKYPRTNKRHHRSRSEDLPSKEGMRRPWIIAGDWKEFSDLLGPLRGFLISRVGQRWDNVYSEIRQLLSPRSTVQIHILSHVFQFVTRHTVKDPSDEIRAFGRYGCHAISPGGLYVHPDSGILYRAPERAPPWRRSKPNGDPNKKEIGGQKAERIGGIWYWVQQSERTIYAATDGVAFAQTETLKRQLCRKELRRHGLENASGL